MMELLTYSIRFLSMFLSCLYCYTKLAGIKLKVIDLLFIPVFAVISAGLYYVWRYVRIAVPVCIYVLSTVAFFVRYRRRFYDVISINTIAMGVMVVLMAAASLCSLIVSIPAHLLPKQFQDIVVVASFCVLLMIFTLITFSIKRFKNGIATGKNDEVLERLILAGAICIFGMTLTYTSNGRAAFLELGCIFIAFCCLSLIIWWRKLVSTNYRKQILNRNVEILQESVAACEDERTKLAEQNEELAKIIHRDNKLLPAMEIAVKSLCEKYRDDEQAQALFESINAMFSEKAQAVETFYTKSDVPAQTGILTLDSILKLLYGKAAENGTQFFVDANKDAVAALAEKITEITDLNTLLCDLGENALIAVKNIDNGKVKIIFGEEDGFPAMKIFDNGAQFDEKVITEMGRSKVTTHGNDGGSGIGLSNAFLILNSYSVSFCIDETIKDDMFTKCVIICADGKGLHRIKTERENVKKICASRNDFYSTENL